MIREVIHLHNHSRHSFLDGQASIKNMLNRAKELGIDSIALTNHGNVFGIPEFYQECVKREIKPILGCLLKGQEIITSMGVKPVEDIKVGDLVLTHKGRFRKVLQTSTRLHKGKLYDIELAGHGGRKLTLTDEHPVLIRNTIGEVDWVRADEIIDGRPAQNVGLSEWNSYVGLPKLEGHKCILDIQYYLPDDIQFNEEGICSKIKRKNKHDHYHQWPTLNRYIDLKDGQFCYLLGLFTAEGSFGTYDDGSLNGELRWSFHIDEAEYAETVLDSVLTIFGLECSVHYRPERHLQEVYFSCMPLAHLFASLVGVGSYNKRVPQEIFEATHNVRLAFLNGVLDGDGKNPNRVSNVGKQSTLKVASKDLAWGIRQLLADQGHWVNVAAVFDNDNARLVYQVPVNLERRYARSIETHKHIWKPIRSVVEREDVVQVFNFEVEEDHSYVSDFILHNCEFYLVRDADVAKEEKDRHAHHLVVLAENETGWKNICRLTTLANQNFYYKPRIDIKMLEKHREGIIVLTACMHGPVSYWLFDKMSWPKEGEESQLKEAANIPKAYEFARELQRALGADRLYLEVQDGGIPEQLEINKCVRKMAGELGLKTVATQDAHYVYPEDAEAHSILKAIGFGKTAVEAGSHGFSTNEFYLKTRDQMLEGDLLQEEIDRTLAIGDRCNVTLELHQNRLPKYPYTKGQTSLELLKDKVNAGWKRRKIVDSHGTYKERVMREVRDIEGAGLEDYFLIVADITDFCHEQDIPVGSARGSAGGSLVSYLLGITDLDPIKYGLMWERFYNAGRQGSMPDIDTDVDKIRRDEVLAYIRERFGENRVAQIVTLSSMGAKGILKDVLRVIGIDFDTANKISGLVPAKNEDHGAISLMEACSVVPALKEYADNDQEFEIIKDNKIIRKISWQKIFQIANNLEGCYKTAGMHAAAVVIADEDFDKAGIPLVKGTTKDHMVCGWDMDAVDAFGLLKVDILGLATLSVVKTCLDLIKERHGVEINIGDIPLDDPKVGRLISSGYNEGVFQLESTLGKGWSKKCQPGLLNPELTVEEIAELVAIIRPACLETGMADTYAKIKSGEEEPSYIHALLEPILAPTKGILLYQEQVMAICQEVAGMDLQEADKVRKTIGKKKPEELRQKKEQFMDGAKSRVPLDVAEEIWGWIEKQAGYGFNKSHAVGYAIMAYRTAWLKANYYIEFLCANLMHANDKANQQRTPHDVIAAFINDAKLNDVHIIPPLLEESENDFKIIDDNNIIFGFGHIKGVGKAAMASIRKCRSAQSFDEFTQLARQHRLNKTVIESFIHAGVLDKFGMTRRSMRNQYRLLDSLTDKERDSLRKLPKNLGLLDQISMLGDNDKVDQVKKVLMRGPNIARRAKIRDIVAEFKAADHKDTMPQILLWEKEYLGTTISGSLADLNRAMKARNSCIELGRGEVMPDQNVELCVVVEAIREHIIKKGKNAGTPMGFLTISDSSYRLDNITVFTREYTRIKGQIEPGDIAVIDGRMTDRGLVANKIRRL